MKIQITPAAEKSIKQSLQENSNGYAVLVYDSEGCGCAVSGVPALWIVNPLDEEDTPAECNMTNIYYKPRQAIFFDESMKIDYNTDKKSFILSSSNQIFNANMSVIDKR